jgi:glycosyltransferase involved in cell wall biosynthesis
MNKKIKIVEIILSLSARGGAEVFFASLVEEISKRKDVEITVVSLWDDIDESFDYIKDVTGISFYSCNKKSGPDFKAARKLRKIIKKANPDIIHTHRSILLTYFLAFGFRKRKWKIVHTVHNVANKESNNVTKFLRERYMKKNMIYFIGISNLITESLKDYHKNPPVRTIYNAIELKPIVLTEESKEYDFICVAGFREQKNHKLLIRAFNKLYSEDKKLKLICIGDGELFEEIKEMTNNLPCNTNVIFAGAQKEVYPYLLKSKVFVLSSFYEGNPISILEAMNCGLPVVAPNVGGIPDVVTDKENGILFPVNDEQRLVEACKMLLDDQLRNIVGKNNKKKIEKYSMFNCVNEHFDYFNEVIKKKK